MTGVATGLSFPDPSLSYLAWVAWIPLFIMLESTSVSVFRLTWSASFIGFTMNLAWVRHTMIDYGGIAWPLAVLFVGLLAAYCALFQAVALVCAFRIRPVFKETWCLIPAACWVSFEYLRTYLFSGFPWNALGLSQYNILPVLQNARWGSFYGISFMIIMVNTVIALMIRQGKKKEVMRQFLATVLVMGLAIGYGFSVLSHADRNAAELRVALIQPNIPQDLKWQESYRGETLEKLIQLSESLRDGRPELIVWPESSITFLYRFAGRYRTAEGLTYADRINSLIQTMDAPLLTGTLDQLDSATYNAAVLVPRSGGLEMYYYKEHLVPFGEYVPLPSMFFFVNRLVEGAIGTFDTGESAAPLIAGTTRIGMTICYEGVFPDLVRRRVAQGADVLCNITNDAWFGRSWAPEQHFSNYCYRAVENARPVIRAANTGITGAIDACGRPITKSDLFTPDAKLVTVGIPAETTFYTRFGDVFSLSCVLFCVIAATIRAVRRRTATLYPEVWR